MAMAAFSLFLDLPIEIQDKIWSHAVRPVPGKRHVHNFLLIDHFLDGAGPKRSVPGDYLRFEAEGGLGGGARLAVPHDNPLTELNDSVYIADTGLWMACRASRAAMERHFQKNEWWSDIPAEDRPRHMAKAGDFFGQQDVAHSASCYSTIDGICHEARHVTICPEKDLIIIKHPGLISVDWFHFYAWNGVPLMDFRGSRNPEAKPSFLGVNVAFDYDPAWLDILVGNRTRRCHIPITADSMSIVDMIELFHEDTGRTLWFVDHRLRRREKTPSAPSNMSATVDLASVNFSSLGMVENTGPEVPQDVAADRYIFRSINHVYTEIRKEDLHEWTVIDNVEDPGTVFDFFDVINQLYNGRLQTGGSNRMRVLARDLTPGINRNVDVPEMSYRKYLGDANFNHAVTAKQKRDLSQKANGKEEKKAEAGEENDIFDDMDDFSLFSDLE